MPIHAHAVGQHAGIAAISLVPLTAGDQPAAAKRAIDALLLEMVPITGPVAEEAAGLRARHPSLRIADALVVATGSFLGAAVVLTGDARWRGLGQSISVL